MRAYHAISWRVLNEWDHCDLFRIALDHRISLLHLAIVINREPEAVIFALFWQPNRVDFLLYDFFLTFLILAVRVTDGVLGFNNLDSDEAVGDFRVGDALHIVFIYFLERYHLIAVLEVILEELIYEISTWHPSLVTFLEAPGIEHFLLLFRIQNFLEPVSNRLVNEEHDVNLVFHFHG